MGGGASTSSAGAIDSTLTSTQLREQKRKEFLAKVETFVVNSYANSPKIESTWLVLSSETGQKAFANFVKAARSEEAFLLFKEISLIRSKKYRADDPQLLKQFHEIYEEFLKFTLEKRVVISYELQSSIEETIENMSMKGTNSQASLKDDEFGGFLMSQSNESGENIGIETTQKSTARTHPTSEMIASGKTEEPLSPRAAIGAESNRFTLLTIDPNISCHQSPPATPLSPSTNQLLSLIVKLQDEVVNILANQLFHKFLTSKFYSAWRALDSSHARATTADDATAYSSKKAARKVRSRWSFMNILSRSRSVESHHSNSESVKISFDEHRKERGVAPEGIGRASIIIPNDNEDFDLQGLAVRNSPLKSSTQDSNSRKVRATMRLVTQPSNMTFTALGSIHEQQLVDIAGSPDSWLAVLISASELLPVAISLASANNLKAAPAEQIDESQVSKFPLIFVNKAFEKLTGFDRARIQGKAIMDHIQSAGSSPEAVSLLSTSLESAKEVVTPIVSKKSNGKRFNSIAGLKPIRDSNGRYSYVIGVHFDITNVKDSGVSHSKLAAALLSYLPDTLLPMDAEAAEEPADVQVSKCGWW